MPCGPLPAAVLYGSCAAGNFIVSNCLILSMTCTTDQCRLRHLRFSNDKFTPHQSSIHLYEAAYAFCSGTHSCQQTLSQQVLSVSAHHSSQKISKNQQRYTGLQPHHSLQVAATTCSICTCFVVQNRQPDGLLYWLQLPLWLGTATAMA